MSTDRTLSGLPTADGLTDDDLILVTQGGLSKKATVAQLQAGIIDDVVFQQEATESEALAGLTSDTVMTSRRVRAVTDDFKRFIRPVEGLEHLAAFHNALIAGTDPVNIVISGDSTTRGYSTGSSQYMAPQFVPQTILANQLRRIGVEGVHVTGLGRSGATSADWLSTYLAEDLTYNPKLYIWHWAINDPVPGLQDLTPEQTRDILRAGLTTYRAEYPHDEGSILILSPNMSDATSTGRTTDWFDTVIGYMRQAAKDYECAFVDIYTPWKNADGTMMYTEQAGVFVHPGNGMSLQSWSLVADAIIPLGLRRPVATTTPDLVKRRQITDNAWLTSDPDEDNSWRGVCWADGYSRLVAVGVTGTGNRVTTSDDGVTWTARTSASDDNWQEVAYAPVLRRLVAVASNGGGSRVMSSDDGGVTWTSRTPSQTAQWLAICWSPDRRLFAAVALSGAIMTSPDGITWTDRTAPNSNVWQAICWSQIHGLFVAVGSSGTGNRVMTSYDGITWTSRTSAADKTWIGVCVAERLGLFVAVANDSGGSNIMTSPDGITWTLGAGYTNNLMSVAYYEEVGLFCAVCVAGTGDRVAYSTDGVTWTAGESAADNGWQSICVAPELGLFCAMASDGTGTGAMTSTSAHAVSYRS